MKIVLRSSPQKPREEDIPLPDNQPTLRIIIGNADEDDVQAGAKVLWHPEDELEGNLQISSFESLNFEEILVRFSGTIRTWMTKTESDSLKIIQSFREQRFLTQAQYLRPETGLCRQTAASQTVYSFPFNFTISPILLSGNPDATEHFLRPPPSLHEGEATTTSDGRLFMQPLITYSIQAVVRSHAAANEQSVETKADREILLTPFTEASPPLEVGDFPGEFLFTSTKPLKASRLAESFGEMSISMAEPSPLRFSATKQDAGTVSKLQLTLRLAKSISSRIKPHNWTCTIESHILVKTFYSTAPLRCMPWSRLMDTQSRLELRTRAILLSTRTIDLASWTIDPHNPSITPARNKNAPWTMTLDLPANVSETLPPTFCSTFAARRYALRLRLTVKGLHHPTFVLLVPVQVLYCGQTDLPRETEHPSLQSPLATWSESDEMSEDSFSELGPCGIYSHAEALLPEYHRG